MRKKTSACLETAERQRHRLVEENEEGTVVEGILEIGPLKVGGFDRQRDAGPPSGERT